MGNLLSTSFQPGFGSGGDSEGTNSGDRQTTNSRDLPTGVTPLNDSLYQLYKPPVDLPTVDIIFFHGLQIGDYRNAYWKTWSSDGGKTAWPQTLLGEKALPSARIMSVSYDSSTRLADRSGRGDLFRIAEKLVQDIILCKRALVGRNRPVILVGHSLGGIVIKKFILMASHMMDPKIEKNQMKIEKLHEFIGNVRGVFYYATPHRGSPWANYISTIRGNSKVIIFLTTLSEETERLNEDFRKWRAISQTKTFTIAESYKTDLGFFKGIIVPEGSCRSDTDGLYSAAADHFTVCKPTDMSTASFRLFKEFIEDNVPTLTSAENRQEEDKIILLYRDEDATSKRLMQNMHITVEEVEERKEVEDLQKREHSSRPDTFEDLHKQECLSCPDTLVKVRSSESAICTENPNLTMVEEFITEINIGYDSGYFVSKAWMLSLDDHENEALTSALRQTGYLEIYKTDTTVFYEKINGLSCTPENTDFGDFVDPEVIASARSFKKRRQSAPVQSDQTPVMDSPKSIQDKGKMPLATSNEILESFKTAIQDTSLDNYSVSTQWLSTLSKQEEENLKFALSKAGYLEIERTSTTTYFERLQGHVCNNPKNESESSSTFQKRSVGGAESKKAFQGSEGLLADDRQRPNIDKQGSSSVTTTQESHKREVTCPCHPEHLTVSCTPEPSEEPSTSSSSQGGHMSESSTRKAVGDSYVTMPITREGKLMPTEADKRISMSTYSFSELLPSGGSGFNEVSLKVSAYTSLMCCLKSDPNEKKVCIEFSTIGGRVQIEGNVNLKTNSMVLRSVRSNVNACIICSGRTDHFEPSTREPVRLYVQESDARRPWRKVLETYEAHDENGQPRRQDDLVWMQLSGNRPQNSELESKTLELQCHVKNRLHYDLKMCCHDAHVLEFTERDPVILEGKILGDLKSDTILELNVRYQVVISYNEPRLPKAGQQFVVTTREDKTVDFDFVLKFKTRKFSSS